MTMVAGVRRVVTRVLLAVAGLVAVSSPALLAHPAATTSVTLVIHESGKFDVRVESDAEPLRQKLEALQTTLLDTLHVEVDQKDVTLTATGTESVPNAAVPRVVATFTGRVPPQGAIRFHSSLVFGSYPLIVRRDEKAGEAIEWLAGPQASQPIPVAATVEPKNGWAAVVRDFAMGYTHILPEGVDHILFVLGLFLLSPKLKSMLAQVSAFTLAHSITLGLTLYGVVSLPSSIVEPLIALSIVYVACENLFTSSLSPWRLALVFGFGLLHGMGFAEALSHLHLARSHFLATLVSFNVGVEAGQLTVIAVAATAVWLSRVPAARRHSLVVRPASLGIAVVGAFWVVERLL